MKKTLLILLAAALFAGCSKSSQKASGLLVGTWYLKKDSSNSFVNSVQLGQNVTSYTNKNNYLTFNNDGTGDLYLNENTSNSTTQTFNYTQNSNTQVTLNFPSQLINNAVVQAFSRTETILTLTSTNLVLQYQSSVTNSGTTTTTSEVEYFSSN